MGRTLGTINPFGSRCPAFTTKDDEMLMDLHKEHGDDWKKIAILIGRKDWECKLRYRMLTHWEQFKEAERIELAKRKRREQIETMISDRDLVDFLEQSEEMFKSFFGQYMEKKEEKKIKIKLELQKKNQINEV